jgi:hypothetical protein
MPHDTAPTVNLAVLRGVCSAPTEVRRLSGGRRVASLSVRTRGPGAHATSVPVSVWEPAAWVEDLDAGDELIVVGVVHRRFFRTAGGTPGARAEVEATHVARPTSRGIAAALRRAEAALDGLV